MLGTEMWQFKICWIQSTGCTSSLGLGHHANVLKSLLSGGKKTPVLLHDVSCLQDHLQLAIFSEEARAHVQ